MSIKGTIICFGDSNTYGYDPQSSGSKRFKADQRWTGILQQKTGFRVINVGKNGRCIPSAREEIEEVCGRLPQWSKEKKPLWLWIMLGTNDILHLPEMTAEKVTERMEHFLKKLLACREVESGEIQIRLIAPVPLKRGEWVKSDRICQESARMSEEYRNLAERLHIDFADAGQWDVELIADGVHFAQSGHEKYARGIVEVLEKQID